MPHQHRATASGQFCGGDLPLAAGQDLYLHAEGAGDGPGYRKTARVEGLSALPDAQRLWPGKSQQAYRHTPKVTLIHIHPTDNVTQGHHRKHHKDCPSPSPSSCRALVASNPSATVVPGSRKFFFSSFLEMSGQFQSFGQINPWISSPFSLGQRSANTRWSLICELLILGGWAAGSSGFGRRVSGLILLSFVVAARSSIAVMLGISGGMWLCQTRSSSSIFLARHDGRSEPNENPAQYHCRTHYIL